jgi:hypothetical protein
MNLSCIFKSDKQIDPSLWYRLVHLHFFQETATKAVWAEHDNQDILYKVTCKNLFLQIYIAKDV